MTQVMQTECTQSLSQKSFSICFEKCLNEICSFQFHMHTKIFDGNTLIYTSPSQWSSLSLLTATIFLSPSKTQSGSDELSFSAEAKNSSLLLHAASKGLNILLTTAFFFYCVFCFCKSFVHVLHVLFFSWCISVTVPTAPLTGLARVQLLFHRFHVIPGKTHFSMQRKKQRNSHKFALHPQGLDVFSWLCGA